MGRHVTISVADTDVGALNGLIQSIEVSLRGTGTSEVSALDFGFENLFVDHETAKRIISKISYTDINPNEARCIKKYSRIGVDPKENEKSRFELPKTKEERANAALENIDRFGITDLIVVGGINGLKNAYELQDALKGMCRLYGIPLNMDGDIGYALPNGDITQVHSIGHPSACVDLVNQTIMYDKFVHNSQRAMFLTTLGGGTGHIAAAGTAGQAMMIMVPEIENIIQERLDEFCKLATWYLDQHKSLVVTVAEKTRMPTSEKYKTKEGVDAIKKQQAGHGITEGNYMAAILNAYFGKTGCRYCATDEAIGYRSRCATVIDFDRKLANVMGKYVAELLVSTKAGTTDGNEVVIIPAKTHFSNLEKEVKMVPLRSIATAKFEVGEGGYLDKDTFTTTQEFRDRISEFCRARL